MKKKFKVIWRNKLNYKRKLTLYDYRFSGELKVTKQDKQSEISENISEFISVIMCIIATNTDAN